jgi:hypothetical protein
MLAGLARPASATGETDKIECATSYTKGQELRRQGSLRAAREQLLVCASERCGKIQPECVRWVTELDETMPSVVLRARDAQGGDVADVRVLLDGAPLVERLDGRTVPVDPGEHTFRFERAGSPPVDFHALIVEAEKSREVSVRFGGSASALPAMAPPVATVVASRPIPWSAYLLGGIGLAGLGTFSLFGVWGVADRGDLEACRGTCSSSQVDAVEHKFIVADVSLGVSVAALGAALVVMLTRPQVRELVRKAPGRIGRQAGFPAGMLWPRAPLGEAPSER